MTFILFISFVILVRIGELVFSKRNEKWLLQHGAVEYGHKHYPYIITLHILFFVSLLVEYGTKTTVTYSLFLLVLYFVVLACKVWVIMSLGKYWNTKIYHISGLPLIKKGFYKYVKHPNYTIVIAEIILIPLIFHLYVTAIIFSLLNMIILFIRINEENRVLKI